MTIDADSVAAIRSRMGLTQGEMASLCGVSLRTWRRWETGGATEMVAKLLSRLELEGVKR